MRFFYFVVGVFISAAVVEGKGYTNCAFIVDQEQYQNLSSKALKYVATKKRVPLSSLFIMNVSNCDYNDAMVIVVAVAAHNQLTNWDVALDLETYEPFRIDRYDSPLR